MMLLGGLFAAPGLVSAADDSPAGSLPAADLQIRFDRDVRPIPAASCQGCHDPKARKGGRALRLKAGTLAGDDAGPVILPGKPTESRLLRYVAGLDDDRPMPPEGIGDPPRRSATSPCPRRARSTPGSAARVSSRPSRTASRLRPAVRCPGPPARDPIATGGLPSLMSSGRRRSRPWPLSTRRHPRSPASATPAHFDGKRVPAEDQRYAFIQPDASPMTSRFRFARHARSGAELSEMLPELAKVVDDLAILKSVHADKFNHAPAQILVNTASSLTGRPSIGSWVTYGLGSEVVGLLGLSSAGGTSGGTAKWSCGFLPAADQGVPLRSRGDPILNVVSPPGVAPRLRRETLNRRHLGVVGDPEIEARIASDELAYRIQTDSPEPIDLSGESNETLELYEAKPGAASFASNYLLARRLLERGIRFGLGRDHHPQAFTMWLAGGIRPGITLGATDDLGFHITQDPVDVDNLQATVLHLLGLDHTRLTYQTQGRDFRLTDVGGAVVEKLLA